MAAKIENPFSKRRAEDFNHNYLLLAHTFAKPHFWENLQGRGNFFLIGSRGSGKSMILRNMSAESEAARIQSGDERADETPPYIGVYLKVHTGTFMPLKPENRKHLLENDLMLFFGHYFNMIVCVQMLKTLQKALDVRGIKISPDNETMISERIASLCGVNCIKSPIGTISELISLVLKRECQNIRDFYVSIRTPGRSINWNRPLTDVSSFLDEVGEILRETIPWIEGKRFYILLDEYEHLHEYQQQAVNTLIKHRPVSLSFKVAARQMGIRTYSDNIGEELQDPDDYTQQTIDYNLADTTQRNQYENLLRDIFQARLKYIGLRYSETEPRTLLQEIKNEIPNKALLAELKADIERSNKKQWSEEDKKQRLEQFRLTYTYRYLNSLGVEKIHCGFRDYCLLSSGIIRRFLMLCAETFELARQKGIEINKGEPISPKIQNRAARNVSKGQFLRIERNCGKYGRRIMQLCEDFGVILRAKLHDTASPEACRLEIKDPQNIKTGSILDCVLETAQKWSIFQTEDVISYRPKGRNRPLPSTFILNRIYAPFLDISPRARWRTSFTTKELNGLLASTQREETLKYLTPDADKRKKVLSKKKGEGQTSHLKRQREFQMESTLHLSNCPVTGQGCNQSLLDYSAKDNCFLASPFKSSGKISDARRLIKQIVNEDIKITCRDVDDFPYLGYVLCKICSCVRQYNFGLFEISSINRNVMFELGMAVGLNKLAFMLFCDKLSDFSKDNFPPPPLTGIEYIPYEIARNNIKKALEEKVIPRVRNHTTKNKNHCSFMGIDCPSPNLTRVENKVLLGLPQADDPYFQETIASGIRSVLEKEKLEVEIITDAKDMAGLCNICKKIRGCCLAIIDTSEKPENATMSFALGLVFGTDGRFIQTHNTESAGDVPLSDTKKWCIEYSNVEELLSNLEPLLKSNITRD